MASHTQRIEDGTVLIQLDQGPEIPSSMPLPSGMASAVLHLLSEDEIKEAVEEGRRDHAKSMEKKYGPGWKDKFQKSFPGCEVPEI